MNNYENIKYYFDTNQLFSSEVQVDVELQSDEIQNEQEQTEAIPCETHQSQLSREP